MIDCKNRTPRVILFMKLELVYHKRLVLSARDLGKSDGASINLLLVFLAKGLCGISFIFKKHGCLTTSFATLKHSDAHGPGNDREISEKALDLEGGNSPWLIL